MAASPALLQSVVRGLGTPRVPLLCVRRIAGARGGSDGSPHYGIDLGAGRNERVFHAALLSGRLRYASCCLSVLLAIEEFTFHERNRSWIDYGWRSGESSKTSDCGSSRCIGRLRGLIKYVRGSWDWGVMERRGFSKPGLLFLLVVMSTTVTADGAGLRLLPPMRFRFENPSRDSRGTGGRLYRGEGADGCIQTVPIRRLLAGPV